jgi:ArsR family transcriptional regulator
MENPPLGTTRPPTGLSDDGTDGSPGASDPLVPDPTGAAGDSLPGGRHPPVAPSPRPAPATSGDVARLLSLLADKTRMRILRILAGGERPVVALTGELGLPQPTVSHHLAWLRMMDLVAPRRQGKHVFYALGPAVRLDADGSMTLAAADATVTIRPRVG